MDVKAGSGSQELEVRPPSRIIQIANLLSCLTLTLSLMAMQSVKREIAAQDELIRGYQLENEKLYKRLKVRSLHSGRAEVKMSSSNSSVCAPNPEHGH